MKYSLHQHVNASNIVGTIHHSELALAFRHVLIENALKLKLYITFLVFLNQSGLALSNILHEPAAEGIEAPLITVGLQLSLSVQLLDLLAILELFDNRFTLVNDCAVGVFQLFHRRGYTALTHIDLDCY